MREEEHDTYWNQRLLEWLDGDLDPVEADAVEAHQADCTLCQRQLRDLVNLDESLRAAIPHLALGESFDRRIFAQIDAGDEAQRAAARRRAEQELQENLRALSRGWRRTLGVVIPGVIAGVALAFALTSLLAGTSLTHTLVAASAGLGAPTANLVQLMLTGSIGAAIGLIVARWLATAAD